MSFLRPALLASAATLALAACSSREEPPAPVVYRTPVSPAPVTRPEQPSAVAPANAPSPRPSGQADARGVVYYDGYETVRARAGDNVDTMAARVGISGAELAAYNGLSTQYAPREGDELVLPPQTDRYQQAAVQSAPVEPPASTPMGAPVDQEFAAAIVAAPTPAPSSSAGSAGWSAELAREAIANSPDDGGEAAASAPPPPRPEEQTASVTSPPAPAPAPSAAPPTTSAGGIAFMRPVDAAVSRPYSRTPGAGRNDGVDFATSAGDAVHAAADGEVALISQSLGGLGTIVLLRHQNDYLTVYGRIDGVTVAKGDKVKRGQVIARVADLPEPQGPSLHFEVRRGAESIDPSPWL